MGSLDETEWTEIGWVHEVERVEFPYDTWRAWRKWDDLWCAWFRFHTIDPLAYRIAIDWVERELCCRRISFPSFLDEHGEWLPMDDLAGDIPTRRVEFQLESVPRPFPALPPGAVVHGPGVRWGR